jgi:hypothetical protein
VAIAAAAVAFQGSSLLLDTQLVLFTNNHAFDFTALPAS